MDASSADVDDFEVKWCPEQDMREKCNCQKGGKKCIVRKDPNGKILTRDLDSPIGACDRTARTTRNFYLERAVKRSARKV